MRDLDALCGLFPEDVRVSRDRSSGRRALKVWFDQTLREQFTGTAHVTGNHIIEFEGSRRRRVVSSTAATSTKRGTSGSS